MSTVELGVESGDEDDAGMWKSVASYVGNDTIAEARVSGALTPTSKRRDRHAPGPLFQHSPGLSPISSQREKAKYKAKANNNKEMDNNMLITERDEHSINQEAHLDGFGLKKR